MITAMAGHNLTNSKTSLRRGFCFPAIRQGYSRDALHQYPCHSAELQKKENTETRHRAVFFVSHSGNDTHSRLVTPLFFDVRISFSNTHEFTH